MSVVERQRIHHVHVPYPIEQGEDQPPSILVMTTREEDGWKTDKKTGATYHIHIGTRVYEIEHIPHAQEVGPSHVGYEAAVEGREALHHVKQAEKQHRMLETEKLTHALAAKIKEREKEAATLYQSGCGVCGGKKEGLKRPTVVYNASGVRMGRPRDDY